MLARIADKLYRRFLKPRTATWFLDDLIEHTGNFAHVTWLGRPVWQNVFDLWILQETIAELRPALLIETGTHRGGSALFFAHLFDLLGMGEVVTIDIETLTDLRHPRVTFLVGDSVSPGIVDAVRSLATRAAGPVMVTLDSDHSAAHVRSELAAYAPLVTPGSWCLVQDGIIDTLPRYAAGRPGPLAAIEDFLKSTSDFELDVERSRKFLISHHPKGWLRRKLPAPRPVQ